MTLIATAYRQDQGFLLLADTLISQSPPSEGDQNSLPLQFGLGNNFGTHGIRCASKGVLFGDYLVLWAGKLDSARLLINKFKLLEQPTEFDFHQIISENPDLSKDVQLIYACNSDGTIWCNSWRCKSKQENGLELIAGGTGDDDFLEGSTIQNESPEFSSANASTSGPDFLVKKLGEFVNLEFTSYVHKWSAYGGAYELFRALSGGGFERMNYAITEFSHRDHIEQKWSDYMENTKLIQCVGKTDRSVFFVQLFSCAGTKLKVFNLEDVTQDNFEKAVTIEASELEPDVSFAYVIGTNYLWYINPDEYFSRFVLKPSESKTEMEIDIAINEDAARRVINRYYEKGGAIVPGSSGFDPWDNDET